MIKFNSSPRATIGVEIELQLVDKNNLNLKNIASKILADVDEKFSDNIKCELIQSMIEINKIFVQILKKYKMILEKP